MKRASRRKRSRKSAGKLKFDQPKEVRAIARERVGPVKPSQTIQDKKQRARPKHKPPAGTLPED